MYQDERKLDFKPLGIAIKKAREAKVWTQELELSRIVQSKKHPKFLIDYCAVCRLQSL